MIHDTILTTIGNTPIIKANGFEKINKIKASIYVKVESFNPGGSMKDRIAMQMIKQAIDNHQITSDTTIIEPTSGNTGIGLASVCASLGYKLIITMPETMSIERQKLVSAYGAKIVLTEGSKGMKGAIEKAKQLHEEITNSFIPSQFENPENPHVHYLTTGPEIYNQMDKNIDVLVAGVGTGGSISGIGKYLKQQDERIEVVAVEPKGSPVLSGGNPGPHKIQGIGAGFIPDTLNVSIFDKVIQVDVEDAYVAANQLAKNDGILVGISSGAVLHAIKELTKDSHYDGKRIVAIMPDGGDRYLSTPLYQ